MCLAFDKSSGFAEVETMSRFLVRLPLRLNTKTKLTISSFVRTFCTMQRFSTIFFSVSIGPENNQYYCGRILLTICFSQEVCGAQQKMQPKQYRGVNQKPANCGEEAFLQSESCRKMSSVEQISKAGGMTTPKSEDNESGKMKFEKHLDKEETPSKQDVGDEDSLINMCQKLGLTTPESERKEPLVQTKPRKKRKSEDNQGETPEFKEAKDEEENLIFLPVSVDLDKLRDWALPGSEGEKGAVVEVNNQQVLTILVKLNLESVLHKIFCHRSPYFNMEKQSLPLLRIAPMQEDLSILATSRY